MTANDDDDDDVDGFRVRMRMSGRGRRHDGHHGQGYVCYSYGLVYDGLWDDDRVNVRCGLVMGMLRPTGNDDGDGCDDDGPGRMMTMSMSMSMG